MSWMTTVPLGMAPLQPSRLSAWRCESHSRYGLDHLHFSYQALHDATILIVYTTKAVEEDQVSRPFNISIM